MKAMGEAGLAGIGKFVMRSRQYLGCLRVREGRLTLEQLYFAEEIDPPKGVIPQKLSSVPERELRMARDLIEGSAGDWDPEKYEDTYHDALMALVKRNQKGEDVHEAPDLDEAKSPPDLLEALRASVEQIQSARGRRRPARASSGRRSGRSPRSSRRRR